MMDGTQFDTLTRLFTQSRRSLLGGALAASAGLLVMSDLDAKKKRKRKKRKKVKPPRPNEFGCFEVGDPCAGEADCCSSICEGGTCRAHDTGICEQGVSGACSATSADDLLALACNGTYCFCFRTTAGSNICSAGPYTSGDSCADCQTDADCEALGFPEGSACAPVSAGICGSCPSGTACLAPCDYQ
jgi:hypothetical protein